LSEEEKDCCSNEKLRKNHRSENEKNNLIVRLNRIEGQIRGVKGMIERDTYCDDVLNQLAAIQAALNGVGKLLLENHMKTCVMERIEDGEPEVIDELLKTINKLIK
jgi:CsoR family transcriptional regulator, copper-sensing transcriptional repressor